MEIIGTNLTVCVGFQTEKFCVLAFIVHSLYPCFRDRCRTLCVICNELRCRKAGLVDLTVYQEGRDTCIICLLNRFDGCIRACVITDDRCRAVSDRRLEHLKLCSCVIIMREAFYFITQFFACSCRDILNRLKVNVGCGRGDTVNNVASAARQQFS